MPKPAQPEVTDITETGNPAYMDHWTQFADQEIERPNSPIRDTEQTRFRLQCADNATRLSDARKEMYQLQSPESVYEWYARLGSTSELKDAEEDLNFGLSIARNNELTTEDDRTMMLVGNLAHELALKSSGEDAQGFFALAAKSYDALVRRYNPNPEQGIDYNQHIVRQAIAYSYDASFARLSSMLRDGLIDQADFDKKYQDKHEKFVGLVNHLARKDSNIGDGELYEWYGEMVLRHELWAMERQGQAEVRRAFTPREDKPHDRFRLGGRHENQQGMLPAYAFDLHLSVPGNNEPPKYIQLKGESSMGRYASPPITVVVFSGKNRLRQQVQRIAGIMQKSYKFETTVEEEVELTQAEQEFAVADPQ